MQLLVIAGYWVLLPACWKECPAGGARASSEALVASSARSRAVVTALRRLQLPVGAGLRVEPCSPRPGVAGSAGYA